MGVTGGAFTATIPADTFFSLSNIEDPGAIVVPPDTRAPAVPSGLAAVAVSSSRIDLSWTASTDDVGVAGYVVFRNGAPIASVTGTSYRDIGLRSSTTYTYTVTAFDGAGNTSAQSAPASATTLRARYWHR